MRRRTDFWRRVRHAVRKADRFRMKGKVRAEMIARARRAVAASMEG